MGTETVPGIQIFPDSKTGATTLHPHDDMLPNGLMEDMLHDPAAGLTNYKYDTPQACTKKNRIHVEHGKTKCKKKLAG